VYTLRKLSRKAFTKEIETVVSISGNGAHVFVPKQWIGKEVRVTLLGDRTRNTFYANETEGHNLKDEEKRLEEEETHLRRTRKIRG
jgi:putative transposon-encoded protein